MTTAQTRYWLGMIASVLTVLGSEAAASLFPSLHHVFTLLGLIGTAVSGYMIQRPLPAESGDPSKE